MSRSDWINVVTFGIGLVLIFVAGFWSGRLWERGDYVRKVMIGEEPPPWDPDAELRELERYFHVRRTPYDWENE